MVNGGGDGAATGGSARVEALAKANSSGQGQATESAHSEECLDRARLAAGPPAASRSSGLLGLAGNGEVIALEAGPDPRVGLRHSESPYRRTRSSGVRRYAQGRSGIGSRTGAVIAQGQVVPHRAPLVAVTFDCDLDEVVTS